MRDLRTDASYKASMAIEVADVVIAVAAFFYLSRVLGTKPDGYDAFGFILIGITVNNAMSTALSCFAQAVKADQQYGTIKPLLAAPLSPVTGLAYASAYPLARSILSAVAYLTCGMAIFGARLPVANVGAAVVVGGAAIGAFAAIGMISAVFTLVLKRGDPLLWLFAACSWLLGGVFFPLSALPPFLRELAQLLPITHALTALRAVLLNGAGLSEVTGELLVLGGMALVGLPLAAALVHAAVIWEKRAGTLGHA
jgi:ABC-2 type transport system permease protein